MLNLEFMLRRNFYVKKPPSASRGNVVRQCKKPTLGQANLVFAYAKANEEKQKKFTLSCHLKGRFSLNVYIFASDAN
jgi:hypothetical protein